jgi:hypothetical protein
VTFFSQKSILDFVVKPIYLFTFHHCTLTLITWITINCTTTFRTMIILLSINNFHFNTLIPFPLYLKLLPEHLDFPGRLRIKIRFLQFVDYLIILRDVGILMLNNCFYFCVFALMEVLQHFIIIFFKLFNVSNYSILDVGCFWHLDFHFYFII